MTLWSATTLFFARPKKILSIQMLMSCNPLGGNFWNFFHIFLNHCTTRSYDYMWLKMLFFLNLVLVLEMVVLERFWWKHGQRTLRVNWYGVSVSKLMKLL